MTIPILSHQDLVSLLVAFPDLDFSDAERQAVLLEGVPRDVQAAPGSGKTTLLAAKLLLMSEKWPHASRGICVLSHTNVARDEIAKRLGATPIGARLLGYPHFVGTIHAFVNQYLALPLLRSDGEAVDVIDNDVFAARALSLLKTKWKLRNWVQKNEFQGPPAIASLRYEGAELALGWENGNLPGDGTDSRAEAQALKDELRAKGVFRHDDMFTFAERLLVRFPDLPKRLSYRFPLVLIDEMQDTSWSQENLLSRVFDGTVVTQRYGDRNQRILSSETDAAKLTFPRAGHLSVTTTKRFPESIASVVRSVQEHGEAVSAVAQEGALQPVLMLYDTKAVTSVIDAFGKYVLATFSDEVLRSGAVKAICARKQGEAKADPGRHVGDYWPAYVIGSTTQKGEESIFRLLADPPAMGTMAFNLDKRVRDIKRSILLALRGAGSTAIADVRDASFLLRKLEANQVDCKPLLALCRDLAIGSGHTSDSARWSATIDSMFAGLSSLFPAGMNRATFGSLSVFELPGALVPAAAAPNEQFVQFGDRSVCIQVGTIASVKGETHLATLVLEAYGGRAKCCDLEAALKSISGCVPLGQKATETMRGLYRNLYVATSRPTHLLCLAMNKERAEDAYVQVLANKGWKVVSLDAMIDTVSKNSAGESPTISI